MSVRLLKSLLLKSALIQSRIEDEQKHRWPDRLRLMKLKKIRLAIKDRLLRLFGDVFHRRTPRLKAQKVRIN